jgi:hypothetical protein
MVGDVRAVADSSGGSQKVDEARPLRSLKSELGLCYGLNLCRWPLARATGISDAGSTIVGRVSNPIGQTEAWSGGILEPPTTLRFAAGLAGFAARGNALTPPADDIQGDTEALRPICTRGFLLWEESLTRPAGKSRARCR